MNITRFLLFIGVLATFALAPALDAHELHLKNGTVIRTDSVQRDGSRLSYQQFGGMITIDLSEVASIHYDQHPVQEAVRENQPGKNRAGKNSGEQDLAEMLKEELGPTTAIEQANLSVITIVTEAGYGSGFFISDDGLIVTNRHVIRGSRADDERVVGRINETEERLQKVQTSLLQEKKRLENYQNNLSESRQKYLRALKDHTSQIDQEQRAEFESGLTQRENYFKQWKDDFSSRYSEYQSAQAEFNSRKNTFYQTSKRLSGQTRFGIILADGSEKSAVFYRVSDTHDLALLKLDGYKTPYLAEEDGPLSLGQNVYAIGSPLKLNNSVTSGVVSNNRGDFIQTNAEIYPGNSGGPLVTEDGRVVGINTMKKITNKFEGLGFAIKFSRVRSEFNDFLN